MTGALKEVDPRITRVAVLRDSGIAAWPAQFGARHGYAGRRTEEKQGSFALYAAPLTGNQLKEGRKKSAGRSGVSRGGLTMVA